MGEKRGSEEARGPSVQAFHVMVVVVLVLLTVLACVSGLRIVQLNIKVEHINDAYTACERNRAYTPELQGQCVEDYLGSR